MGNLDPKKMLIAAVTATAAAIAAELVLTWYRKRRNAKQDAA